MTTIVALVTAYVLISLFMWVGFEKISSKWSWEVRYDLRVALFGIQVFMTAILMALVMLALFAPETELDDFPFASLHQVKPKL